VLTVGGGGVDIGLVPNFATKCKCIKFKSCINECNMLIFEMSEGVRVQIIIIFFLTKVLLGHNRGLLTSLFYACFVVHLHHFKY
jgi:hypothetical protein